MNLYHSYATINQKLAQGVELHYGEEEASVLPRDPRPLRIPRIGVYAGTGTSHSWLWFAELFDRMSFHEILFMTEDMVRDGFLESLDVFAMSGGDTIRIAEWLGQEGGRAIESFIREGGLYIGSCAGAYLPLKSSKQHLDRFNFVDIKIANLSKTRPEAKRMGRKASTNYGCDFVYHPVREDVCLRTTGKEPFTGFEYFRAPLYGGPSMVTSRDSDVLAYYDGFTEKTLFLVEESLAEETLLGKVAAARTAMGDGHLYLFGPHFEHPLFPIANHLVAAAIFWDMKKGRKNWKSLDSESILEGPAKEKLVRDIKREISNSRIVAVGLEAIPVQWIIGCKTYEPEKIRVFLEAIWKRINTLERSRSVCAQSETCEEVVVTASRVTRLLRQMKSRMDDHSDTQDLAWDLFDSLRRLAMIFLQIYFDSFGRSLDS
ncbi:MAG: hypothetical protein HY912_16720 [Desulfomonile tiedjei]|uniref:Biotin-protein ligase N-terminal domain-containing protein n=1 Tax=Desulfomonile tiedjei TaxID=2358 RepID=A0A9D6V410_9BACT|nr:hypothetical protein [Desulfomonile tiedjei]